MSQKYFTVRRVGGSRLDTGGSKEVRKERRELTWMVNEDTIDKLTNMLKMHQNLTCEDLPSVDQNVQKHMIDGGGMMKVLRLGPES